MRLAIFVLLVGCYNPKGRDCSFACASAETEQRCPKGMYCEEASQLCRLDGLDGPCMMEEVDAGPCNDTLSDPNNCGQCGMVCPRFGVCDNGKCAHRVFVTNEAFPNGNLANGDADSLCQAAADARPLGGRWLAWLSIQPAPADLRDPEHKFVKDGAGYALLNGDLIARDWSDLTNGDNLAFNIAITEYGTAYVGTVNVWTNTTSSGQIITADVGMNCINFSVAGTGYQGTIGRLDHRDPLWSSYTTQACACDPGGTGCPARLYCFEN